MNAAGSRILVQVLQTATTRLAAGLGACAPGSTADVRSQIEALDHAVYFLECAASATAAFLNVAADAPPEKLASQSGAVIVPRPFNWSPHVASASTDDHTLTYAVVLVLCSDLTSRDHFTCCLAPSRHMQGYRRGLWSTAIMIRMFFGLFPPPVTGWAEKLYAQQTEPAC